VLLIDQELNPEAKKLQNSRLYQFNIVASERKMPLQSNVSFSPRVACGLAGISRLLEKCQALSSGTHHLCKR
jgi:hypothetical protein